MDGFRHFRYRLDLKQRELAEHLGVSASAVSEIENGDRLPTYNQIKTLLQLGATVEELFGIDCRKTCPNAAKDPPPPDHQDDYLSRREVMHLIQSAIKDALEQPKQARAG